MERIVSYSGGNFLGEVVQCIDAPTTTSVTISGQKVTLQTSSIWGCLDNSSPSKSSHARSKM